NALFHETGDRFGQAYSFCGVGNAHRMMGHFPEALEYFAKAATLYEDIGDEVSYAWTLWSWGTALKVLRRFVEAKEKLEAASKLFGRTRDTRGMVYYLLSVAEIAFLEGERDKAVRFLKEAERSLLEKPFQLEWAHLKLYCYLVGEGRETLQNIYEIYKRIGALFLQKFPSFPINLP
ncbi:MAG: hypothetical protein QXP27_09920, partial [Candidatus Methanomethyliaceae archaeon]